MILAKRRRDRRLAFTLIELLVVIAIIAILMGLTGAAVMRVLIKGPETKTFSDIELMSSNLSAEKSDFGAQVFPSHLRLREDGNYKPNPAVAAPIQADYDRTVAFLQQVFGRSFTPGIQVDWNGDGTITNTAGPSGDMVLEGEQCLVFWLGGKAQKDLATGAIGMTGFPPQLSGGGTGKHGPFYDFQTNRLKMFTSLDPLNGNNPSLPFPVYIDPWNAGVGRPWGQGMPYAYFASYRSEGVGLYQAGDCASLGKAPLFNPATGVPAPYQDPTGTWLNPKTFQIISAGRDGVFGPGGTFNPATGMGTPPTAKDDQTNFSQRILGAPSN